VIPTVAVGAIVFDDLGRVLVVERARPPGVGRWTLPGGRVDAGESLVAAVAREVREETGVIVEVGALAEVVERIAEGFHYVILDYLARVVAGDDARAARFVAIAELASLPTTDGLLPVIERALAQK
jgi:8-oxo-dGTP diphosphatase